jgi:hypothetical protein
MVATVQHATSLDPWSLLLVIQYVLFLERFPELLEHLHEFIMLLLELQPTVIISPSMMDFITFLNVARVLQRPKGITVNCPAEGTVCLSLECSVLSVVTLQNQGWELLGPSQHIQCVISSWWWKAAVLSNVIQLYSGHRNEGLQLSSRLSDSLINCHSFMSFSI